jgi:hypothetical protein
MKAMNLFFLTRVHQHADLSLALEAFSGSGKRKTVSAHEAATLWSLTDRLAAYLQSQGSDEEDRVFLMDGFFFSYVIEHIGKEFDLLKISVTDTGKPLPSHHRKQRIVFSCTCDQGWSARLMGNDVRCHLC